MTPHPSFLALDRSAFVELDGDVAAHVTGCEQCSRYVASLRVQPELPADLAVRAMRAPAPGVRWWPWLVAVAVAVLLVWAGAGASSPSTRVKGAPSAELFVKRGEVVVTWFEEMTLREGDRLQIRLGPTAFSTLEVRGNDEVLFRGALPDAGAFLVPGSFRVDAAPGPERLELRLEGPGLEPAVLRFSLNKGAP